MVEWEYKELPDRRLAADLVKGNNRILGQGGYFSFLTYVRISTIKVATPTMIESSSYVVKRYHLLYCAIGTDPGTDPKMYPAAAISDAANRLPFSGSS